MLFSCEHFYHPPLDKPFDKLRVPSNAEALVALSIVEGLRWRH